MKEYDYSFEEQVLGVLSNLTRAQAALLRQSLSHPPGDHIGAISVLHYLVGENSKWEVTSTYVIAGLFADIWRPTDDGSVWRDEDVSVSLPKAMRTYLVRQGEERRAPLERRFLTLIDTSADGLVVHMRPIMRMLSREGVEWSWRRLLRDVSRWNDSSGRIRLQWAREFYRVAKSDTEKTESTGEYSATNLSMTPSTNSTEGNEP